MPFIDEYMTDMSSWYGDFLNSAKAPEGGLVKSALFLREFATVPWVHLDIAGTAWKTGAQKGATGRPVGLLTHFVLGHAGRP